MCYQYLNTWPVKIKTKFNSYETARGQMVRMGKDWSQVTVWMSWDIFWVTHWGRVMHIGASEETHHYIKYLTQCWRSVNKSLRKNIHWNSNRKSNIFVQGNAFEISTAIWRLYCLGLKRLMAMPTGSHCWGYNSCTCEATKSQISICV